MPYARVRGIDLYYEEHAAGPDVIVAHGALGSVRFADSFGLKTATLAARGFHVVAYDARGHGRSGYTTIPEDYDKAALADDLGAFVDALALPRVSIYGTSMGATTALLFALAHPDRVARLVLRSPSPFDTDMVPARRALHALARSYQWLGVPWTSRIVGMMPGRGDRARMQALVRDQRRAAIVPAIRGFLAEPLSTARLHEIEVPTLILTQPGDTLHPLRSGEILYDRLPHADLCIAPSATFWQQHADRLADLIAMFLHGSDDGPDWREAMRDCTVKPRRRCKSSTCRPPA